MTALLIVLAFGAGAGSTFGVLRAYRVGYRRGRVDTTELARALGHPCVPSDDTLALLHDEVREYLDEWDGRSPGKRST